MFTISCQLSGCPPSEYGVFKTQRGARQALKRRGWLLDENERTTNHFRLRLKYVGGELVYYASIVPCGPFDVKDLPHKKSRIGFRGGKTIGPIR